jgi:hypothetical protein
MAQKGRRAQVVPLVQKGRPVLLAQQGRKGRLAPKGRKGLKVLPVAEVFLKPQAASGTSEAAPLTTSGFRCAGPPKPVYLSPWRTAERATV